MGCGSNFQNHLLQEFKRNPPVNHTVFAPRRENKTLGLARRLFFSATKRVARLALILHNLERHLGKKKVHQNGGNFDGFMDFHHFGEPPQKAGLLLFLSTSPRCLFSSCICLPQIGKNGSIHGIPSHDRLSQAVGPRDTAAKGGSKCMT